MEFILKEVVEYYGLTRRQILERQRGSTIETRARHAAIYLIRTRLGSSYLSIGAFLQRDHTSAIHGYQRVTGDAEIRHECSIISVSVDKVGKSKINSGEVCVNLCVKDLSPNPSPLYVSIYPSFPQPNKTENGLNTL